MTRALVLCFLLGLALAACAGQPQGDPAKAVEQYLQAKVERDATKLQSLLCAEMENALEREARTFDSVTGVTIEGMQCTANTGQNTVTCTGTIKASYGTEETEFPLGTYRVVQEDDGWKWCGEA